MKKSNKFSNMALTLSRLIYKPSNFIGFIAICCSPLAASATGESGSGLLGLGVNVSGGSSGVSVGVNTPIVGGTVSIGGPVPADTGSNVPLDGGLSLLLAAGAGIGVKKYKELKANRNKGI